MANLGGLLDIFGTVPSYASGLLSEEELDMAKARARSNALLQMGKAFYEAGAPRETPGGSTLSGVANALLSGTQAYQGAVKGSIEEKLNAQKIKQALDAQKRAAEVQSLIQGAYRPARPATTPPIGVGQPAQPARFDIQAIAPQLMQTAEGRSALSDILASQKAMLGDTVTLAKGATLARLNPVTGQPETVATGTPDSDLSANFATAVDALGYQRKNANQYTPTELSAINQKMQELAGKAQLSDDSVALMQNLFNTKDFSKLTSDQQRAILSYEQAPSEKDVAQLVPTYAQAAYETPGFVSSLPLSKPQVAANITKLFAKQPTLAQAPAQPGVPQVDQAPAVKRPFTRDQAGNVQITPEFAAKPMGEKEVPLIQSAALSAKDKNELAKTKPKTTQAVETALNSNRRLKRSLIQLRDHPGFVAAFGFGGDIASQISGTDAANAKAILEQIEGKAFITSISDMRNASATGAAVGSVTEREGDKLQRAYSTLKQSQSPDEAKREVDNLIKALDETENISINAYTRTYGSPNFMLIPVGTPPAAGVPSGVRVRKK